MRLPEARGPLSNHVISTLRGELPKAEPSPRPVDPLADDDLQLALYLCYELHYRGFENVADEWEWDPRLLGFRRALEAAFEQALARRVPQREAVPPERVGALLFALAAEDRGPSLSRFLATGGTAEHFREFAIHRSAYQLKEADPHTWGIPRLEGAAKSALVEVQTDEYGSGQPERMHSRLFAEAMDVLGLDSSYGAYLELLPGTTLATVNLISLFGLHRRWRGALVGHLAAFEITSPEPNRRYANGLRRLGLGAATPFYDEHVEADSVHENIAAYDLAGGLARQEPELGAEIVFGAEALLELDARFASALLESWQAGRSLLRGPADEKAALAV